MPQSESQLSIPPLLPHPAIGLDAGTAGKRALAVVIGLSFLGAACFTARFALSSGFAWHCPVMTLLHFPCPSCGSTRALAALSEFHLLQAWRFNPLLITAIPGAAIGFLFRAPISRLGSWLWPLAVAAVFLNWVYLGFCLPR